MWDFRRLKLFVYRKRCACICVPRAFKTMSEVASVCVWYCTVCYVNRMLGMTMTKPACKDVDGLQAEGDVRLWKR